MDGFKIQGNQSVSKAITTLNKLFLVSSTNLGRNMISLREELDYVKDYMVIQNIHFNRAINMEYIVDESCLDQPFPN